MQQLVKIRKLFDDGTAEVVRIRESACSGDCHKCSGCGATQQTMLLRAENPIQAKPGELVVIQSESAPVLKAAAVLYMVPLALFFAGYFAGELLWNHGALTGCAAFATGIALAVLYDRKVVRRQKNIYTITGYPGAAAQGFLTKGEQDLD